MEHEYPTSDAIISQASELLSRLLLGNEFYWRGLFDENAWSEVTADKRPQTVGDQLTRHFSRGPDPVIEFVRVNRSPHYTVFRKIREVDGKG